MPAPHSVAEVYPAHVDVFVRCACGKVSRVRLTRSEYQAYYTDGQLAQKALAAHTKRARECLISGMCWECQDGFGGDPGEGGG